MKRLQPLEKPLSLRDRGNRVEVAAREYLEQREHRVLETNVFFRVGEIDVIAHDLVKNELVFIEVRARTSRNGRETPLESLGFGKMRRWRMAVEIYLSRLTSRERVRYSGIRMDLLGWDGIEWSWVRNLESSG